MVAAASKQLVETAGVASSTEDVCSPAWLSDADLASTDSTVLLTNLVNESSTNNQPHQQVPAIQTRWRPRWVKYSFEITNVFVEKQICQRFSTTSTDEHTSSASTGGNASTSVQAEAVTYLTFVTEFESKVHQSLASKASDLMVWLHNMTIFWLKWR